MSIHVFQTAAGLPRRKTDVFYEDMEKTVGFRGVLNDAIRYIEQIQLLDGEVWARFVQQFRGDADYDNGWRGEYWGKMMRGACFTYSYTKNETLYLTLTETVQDMLTAQSENGRISSYGVDHEFDSWDLWCRKYVLLGMQYYLEICRDEELAQRIIASMGRQVDYIMAHIGTRDGGKKPITKATRTWRGLNSSSILEPVVRLYSLTGEQKYLDFASYIVKCGGTDVVSIFELAYEDKLMPYQYPVTKAYEMTSCFEGLLEYYRITGEERYKESVIRFADRVLETDFTIIGSSGCTHELFDHSTVRQANTNNGKIAQETCVTVTLMKFFYQLTLLTGSSKYVDAFETALYNAYLGAINTKQVVEAAISQLCPESEPVPLPFDSYSPLTAGTRGNGIGGLKVMADKHYYGCCACIGSAGNGLVAKLACLQSKEGVVLNLFEEGEIRIHTPSGALLTLAISTAYPKHGSIKIQVGLENDEQLKLMIRNPSWSKQTEIRVNEDRQPVQNGYIVLDRKWINGDVISLELDMRTEVLYPISYGSQVLMNHMVWEADVLIPNYDEEDPIAKHHLALRRGPIVLAQENRLGYNVDTPVSIAVKDGCVDASFPETEIAPYDHIVELVVPLTDGCGMHVTDYASAGKLWCEESKMAAWILTANGSI